jgi:hypothetical protein
MRYPKAFTVGAYIYRVVWVRAFDDIDTMGECDPVRLEIRIRKNLSKKKKAETFLHECLHAIAFAYGIEELTEEVIEAIDRPIYMALKANKLIPK